MLMNADAATWVKLVSFEISTEKPIIVDSKSVSAAVSLSETACFTTVSVALVSLR